MSNYAKTLAAVLIGAALIAEGPVATAQTYESDARPTPRLRLMPRTLSEGLFPGFDRPRAHTVTNAHRHGYTERDVTPPNRFRLEPIGEESRQGLGIERERAVNNVLQLRF